MLEGKQVSESQSGKQGTEKLGVELSHTLWEMQRPVTAGNLHVLFRGGPGSTLV